MRNRRKLAVPAAVGSAMLAATLLPTAPAAAQTAGTPRDICFPVDGNVNYTDTWGAPRSGGRTHQATT